MSRKPKVVSKNNKTIIQIQIAKGEHLTAREADALSRDLIAGLFPAKVTEKGKAFRLVFDVTGYMPLATYLKTELNKQNFASLLSVAVETLNELREKFFDVSAILLNHKFVFLNPTTKKLRFIFVPIQFYTSGTSIRDFYMDFVKNAVFSKNSNTDYIDEYIEILNCGINVSMFDLEEYIRKISVNTKSNISKSRCRKCNAVNDKAAQFCASCGMRFGGQESKVSTAYDPLLAVEAVPLTLQDLKYQVVYTAPAIKAWIINSKRNKSYEINKPVFCIGKSENSDCPILDNPVISRNHAEIRNRNEHFFLIDLFSTNKTFINGKPLQTQKEVEICSDNILSFGNEEFVFKIQPRE